MWWPPLHWPIKMTTLGFQWPHHFDMGMDQYLLLIPFLGGWTSIYQLFWCSPGVQGFDTLPYVNPFLLIVYHFLPVPWMSLVLSKDRWSPIPHVFQGGYGPTTGRASSEDNSFFSVDFRVKVWPWTEDFAVHNPWLLPVYQEVLVDVRRISCYILEFIPNCYIQSNVRYVSSFFDVTHVLSCW